ncbi:MAG TPA: hypothetical protein VGB76_20165 [Pyrinomonadaceae bacterium]|jgi:hypothetical protein
MWEEQVIQRIRLQLLALVLAFALTWYAMNPAPGPQWHVGRSEEQPDEKRREEKSLGPMGYELCGTEGVVMKSTVDPAAQDIEDLEWPEVIDIR